MSTQVIADRYAEALFEAAQSAGVVEAVDRDLEGVVELLDANSQLRDIWMLPLVETADKKQLARELLGNRVQPLTLNVLQLLFDKKRAMLIGDLQKAYRERYNQLRRRTAVKVTSALPLDDQTTDALRGLLERQLEQQIDMETAVEPALIGGVVLQIADSVIDNSLRGRLNALRNSLN